MLKGKEVICWSLSTNPLWGGDIYCSIALDLRRNCIKYTSLKVYFLSFVLVVFNNFCYPSKNFIFWSWFTLTNWANVWKQFPVFINITVNVLWCICKKFQYSIQPVLTHVPIIHFNFWMFLPKIWNHCYFQACLSKYVTGLHTFKVSIVWVFF